MAGLTRGKMKTARLLSLQLKSRPLAELNEFLEDMNDAFECGHLDAPYDAREYRVSKLGAQS
jgi:hypothetical protein